MSATTAAHSALQQARNLMLPTREEMLYRDPSVARFWANNMELLEQAWTEWSETDGADLPQLDGSLYHPQLREAIEQAWADPSKEQNVRDLWKEVAPGVFQCQFFDPEKLAIVRQYLERAHEAGVPARPPHGITLNRKGFMLDQRSEGYLAIPAFQAFYRDLMDTYMRPLGRLFFPEYITSADDSNTFAFTIQYQAGLDQSIREHYDASSITLNINLNLPEETFSGSSLYFVDPATGRKHDVSFAPGMAAIHRGRLLHAALPITSGVRSNIVLWLYGKNGRASGTQQYPAEEQLTPAERWRKPDEDYCGPQDTYAPF